MHDLRIAIDVVWILLWVYWLVSAFAAKQGEASRRRIPVNGLTALSVVIVVRLFHGGSFAVQSPVLVAGGAVVFAAGITVAVWARVHLGRNWGLPMTQKAEPELVTSGPYRFVRHPIYTGLLAAVLGTTLATNVIGLIITLILGAYFYYSASVEERNLTATFPVAYPAYQATTKMLVPFIL